MASIAAQVFVEQIFRIFMETMLTSPIFGREAYLDPGSGSYLLQLLIAAIVGSAFMLRTFWARIKALFRGEHAEEEFKENSNGD